MRRLSSLGSKNLAHRKGRSLLTGSGIALGVAILFGVLVSNATTQAGVDRLIEDFTGKADVVVNATGAFDARMSASTLDEIKALPGVREAAGGFGFGAETPGMADEDEDGVFDEGGLFVSGIDLDQERKFQSYELVEGRFFTPGADEIVVPMKLADELSLRVGERLTITTPTGRKRVAVVGVLEDTGAARAGQGEVAYTSVVAARRLAGEGEVFSGIGLILAPGTDVDAWIERHEEAVEGVRLRNADTLAQGFKSFLEVFGTFLTFFAIITLFVGAFLIYLTLSMAVIERTRVYGTLRALGASRRQVRRVVLAEAAVLAVISTSVGLLLGLGLAKGLLALISSLFGLDLHGLVVRPGAVITAVLVGLFVTLASSFVPAVRAGRLAAVEAMKGDYAGETRLGRAWIAGAALLVVSLAIQLGTSGSAEGASSLSPVGVLGILLASILLVPLLLRPLAAALGRVTNRLARGVGDIAVLHLAKERSRSAYTLGLIMIVMAMLFATGGLFLSVRAAVDEIIDRQFGADLFVEGNGPLDPGLEDEIRETEGVRYVSPLRFGFTKTALPSKPHDFEDAFVVMLDPATYFDLSGFFWKDGSDAAAKDALSRGGSVLVSTSFARDVGLERGDEILVFTKEGKRTFDVAGVHRDAPGPPSLTIGLPDARRYFQAAKPMGFIIEVDDGADADVVKDRIEKRFGDDVALDIQTAADNKEQARSQIAQYFQIVYAILLIAAIVGLLGLANTLAMSVLQRFREIGILRAVGVTRSQMWRMVLVESTTLGLVAFVLSIPLGALLTAIVIRDTSVGFGFDMPTVYPWPWVPIVAAFGIVITVVAAIAPGRRAARLEVVSALQYE